MRTRQCTAPTRSVGAHRRRRRHFGALSTLVAFGALCAACSGAVPVAPISTTTTSPTAPTLLVEHTAHGTFLTDGAGYTLYDFVPDTPTHSACVSAECVALWPPLVVTKPPTVGKGLDPDLVSTLIRPDGQIQVVYGGHPLYRWYNDVRPGMITGQAVLNKGGYWYVVRPTGQQDTTPFKVTT